MRDLTNYVIPWVAKKWYQLGLELLQTKYEEELCIIEEDCKGTDMKKCCRKMFEKWLETRQDASWSQLIYAVKNIELINAAARIEKFIQGKYNDIDIPHLSD